MSLPAPRHLGASHEQDDRPLLVWSSPIRVRGRAGGSPSLSLRELPTANVFGGCDLRDGEGVDPELHQGAAEGVSIITRRRAQLLLGMRLADILSVRPASRDRRLVPRHLRRSLRANAVVPRSCQRAGSLVRDSGRTAALRAISAWSLPGEIWTTQVLSRLRSG